MNRRAIMLSVVAVAVAVFAAAAWFTTRPASVAATATVPPEQSEALLRSYSPILGPEDAPVTIVEFFDPACEACRAFYPVVKDIMEEHGDAVRVAIRYTPFHGEASEEVDAAAVLCGGSTGGRATCRGLFHREGDHRARDRARFGWVPPAPTGGRAH